MAKHHDELTKESYKELFSDNFSMTYYAIEEARKQIQAGNEELNVTSLLKEIRKHPPKQESE